jgi:hypothetical protein
LEPKRRTCQLNSINRKTRKAYTSIGRSHTTTKNPSAIADAQHSTIARSKEITGFVPTHDELIQLVKYWVRKAIGDKYFIFWRQCFGGSDLRRIDFDWQRVNEIAQFLGEEETDKAIRETYEEVRKTASDAIG